MPTKASKLSKDQVKDRLLGKLDDIIDGDEIAVRDVLKAIELYGREFGLFIEQRNVKIDVNTVVRQLSDQHLKVLAGEVDRDRDVIDVQPWVDVEQDPPDGDHSESAPAVGGEVTVGVDQGELGADREQVGSTGEV